jgi:nucleotide-binding universal stress UspA family protein
MADTRWPSSVPASLSGKGLSMFKTILVPVRGDEGDKASLGTAFAIATLFGSHIDVAHIQNELPPLVPATGQNSAQMISGLQYVSALWECSKDRRRNARQQYRQFCTDAKIQQADDPPGKRAVSAAWIDFEGNGIEQIIRMAHRHDLIVLQTAPGGNDGFSTEESGEVILSRSGPVMLAPPRPPSEIGRTIVIAWKNTPEAAAALAAAMPFLYRADKIFVVSVSNEGEVSDPSVDGIVRRLRWHGLEAVADPIEAARSSPAMCLMEHVEVLGADLLVMGAYGRNRMREFIFGSFTKQVLSGATLPVFLTH